MVAEENLSKQRLTRSEQYLFFFLVCTNDDKFLGGTHQLCCFRLLEEQLPVEVSAPVLLSLHVRPEVPNDIKVRVKCERSHHCQDSLSFFTLKKGFLMTVVVCLSSES